MTEVKRSLRVASHLAKELAWLLERDLRDPRAAGATVTRVEMTDDLRSATVYVRLLQGGDAPSRRREALGALTRAGALLRRTAARRMGLKYAPELRFVYDEGQDHTARIEELLGEVRAEEARRKPD